MKFRNAAALIVGCALAVACSTSDPLGSQSGADLPVESVDGDLSPLTEPVAQTSTDVGPAEPEEAGVPAEPGSSGSEITVVRNAAVFTVDDDLPAAEAFAYDADGVIIAVGSQADVIAQAGANPRVIDAGGKMVLPGFQDVHVHVPEAGINENLCLLEPDGTIEAYEEALYGCVEEQPHSAASIRFAR